MGRSRGQAGAKIEREGNRWPAAFLGRRRLALSAEMPGSGTCAAVPWNLSRGWDSIIRISGQQLQSIKPGTEPSACGALDNCIGWLKAQKACPVLCHGPRGLENRRGPKRNAGEPQPGGEGCHKRLKWVGQWEREPTRKPQESGNHQHQRSLVRGLEICVLSHEHF